MEKFEVVVGDATYVIRPIHRERETLYSTFIDEEEVLFEGYEDGLRAVPGLTVDDAEWGVDPVYLMKDPKKYADMRKNRVNARSERILEDKRSMWYRPRKNRCLIPVSGTFEHRHLNGWKKKVPYFITEKDRPMIFIPGLYQIVEKVDGDGVIEKVASFAMITRGKPRHARHP